MSLHEYWEKFRSTPTAQFRLQEDGNRSIQITYSGEALMGFLDLVVISVVLFILAFAHLISLWIWNVYRWWVK